LKQEIKERIKKIQNGIVPEGYKKTKVGIIPKDWEVKKLFSIADLVAGATPSTNKSEYWNGSIPWMSSGEINNKIIESTEKHITELGYKESSTKIIPENSILIAIAGQGKTRGKVAINKIKLTFLLVRCVSTQKLLSVIFKSLHPHFWTKTPQI